MHSVWMMRPISSASGVGGRTMLLAIQFMIRTLLGCQIILSARLGQSYPCIKQGTWDHVLSKHPSTQAPQCFSSFIITC
jgi:hypothetical protein